MQRTEGLIMKQLKIAVSNGIENTFCSQREVVNFDCADLTEVSAIVLTAKDIAEGKLDAVKNSHFDIPVFAYATAQECVPVGDLRGVFDGNETNRELYGRQVDTAAQKYEDGLLPPFFGSLTEYVAAGNAQFDCPGHQGGAFYRRHPAGRAFYDFFGESVFRADLCNADVSMGDLLIHEGAPCAAQQAAAKVYNADKTYFVLNGTSASNKVVLNALLTPGDLVLFDRNNHKSNHHGALLHAGVFGNGPQSLWLHRWH